MLSCSTSVTAPARNSSHNDGLTFVEQEINFSSFFFLYGLKSKVTPISARVGRSRVDHRSRPRGDDRSVAAEAQARGVIMSTITQLMTGTYTVEEYERMIDDGKIGEDDQVELIEGRVVAKMPKKPPHRVGTTKTFEALGRVVPAAWHVSKEDAVVVGPRSKPEPDVAVVRAAFKYDASRDPTAADCCLVVEVAERSLAQRPRRETERLCPRRDSRLLDRQREGQAS